ncbi:MAG: Calx-beta domain-containing protein, partial [Planctomycetota bacterium]
ASDDPVYDGVAAADVAITNENRDTATISIATAQANENAGTIGFVVTLDTAIEGGVTVRASTREQTATGGTDFGNALGQLTFAGSAGETETFRVVLFNDNDIEGNETLEAMIGVIEGLAVGINPSDVTISQATAVGTIVEDDLADVGFSVTVAEFDEQAGTQTLTVTLLTTPNAELLAPLSVRISDLGTGTADPSNDFTFSTQTLVFAAGSGDRETQSFTIDIADDDRVETNETIDLGLEIIGDDANGAVGATQQTELTITITDDPQTGVIAGTVRVDSNNDGVLQDGERPLEGVTVRLTGTNTLGEDVTLEQTTDSDGNYRFEGLTAGQYLVTKVQPANYISGTASPGTVGGSEIGTASANQITDITLAAAETGEGYDFTELGLAAGFVDIRSFLATTLASATAPAPIAAASATAADASTAASDIALASLATGDGESTDDADPPVIAFATAPTDPVASEVSVDLAFAAYAALEADDEEEDASSIAL